MPETRALHAYLELLEERMKTAWMRGDLSPATQARAASYREARTVSWDELNAAFQWEEPDSEEEGHNG